MRYPILPLRDIVVFPHMIVPLFVGRDKSVVALEQAMSENKEIILLSQKDPKTENPNKNDLYMTGTIGSILQLLKLPDGTVKALIEGKKRVSIKKIEIKSETIEGEASFVNEKKYNPLEKNKINVLHTIFEDYINLNKKTNNELINIVNEIKDPSHLSDSIISNALLLFILGCLN